jgi:peptide chain release factor 1
MRQLPNIEPFRSQYTELEKELADPDIFKDSDRARLTSREHNRVGEILKLHQLAQNCLLELEQANDMLQDPEMSEAAREEIAHLEALWPSFEQNLLLAMLPSDPDSGRNTIVEIRAGAGGDEASLFAADLFRMYTKYGESQDWSFELLSQNPSETGGFKEVIFLFKGDEVWTSMKFESGVHRVQRIPVTEAGGRIHTSTATVAVLPEAKEIEISIDPNDLEINVCRASGPGGQGVNTTDSAVQLFHKPSGLSVYCADERSQLKNKNKAMTVLRSRLYKLKQAEEKKKYADDRKSQVGSGDRSERIRTYNFPQSRLTDHRINYTSHSLNSTMMGDLDHLLEALMEHDQQARLENLHKGNGD